MKSLNKNIEVDSFIINRIKEIETENRFWSTLQDIGFKVKRNCNFNYWDEPTAVNIASHTRLPITVGFVMNPNDMNIYWISLEPWTYIRGNDPSKPIITCENFIQYLIKRVRNECQEVLEKLDTRKIESGLAIHKTVIQ